MTTQATLNVPASRPSPRWIATWAPLAVVFVLFGVLAPSPAAAEQTQPDGPALSPLASGWLESSDPETDPAGPLTDLAPRVRTSGQLTPGSWCAGDDFDADLPGDDGPDLLAVRSSGGCISYQDYMHFSVRTAQPAEGIEFLFDTDLNAATGCDGADMAFVSIRYSPLSRIVTPDCDPATWTAYQPRYGSFDYDPDDFHNTSGLIEARWARGSRWWAAVGNLDGTGYDASLHDYYVSTQETECTGITSTDFAAPDGYWLGAIDGGIWGFGDAAHVGHSCRGPWGLNQLTDLAGIVVDPTFINQRSWVSLHASGEVVVGAGLWLAPYLPKAPWPWEVGALAAVALIPRPAPLGEITEFWVVYDNGAVIPLSEDETTPWFGDARDIGLAESIIDAVATPDGNGYWLVGSDGGVFSFGTAQFHGSMGGLPLNQPVVGIVADPDNHGYWLVAADGGVFAFDAPFQGSIPGILSVGATLNQPIIGMIPYGNGYLMLASDGGVFNFSNRTFQGSLGDSPPQLPIVAVAATP
ncbi:MAG: hypothetical protein GY925_08175 [Actinomycetia bacterium]|nr:hypothetical protein [Actinomycetes bacterium]